MGYLLFLASEMCRYGVFVVLSIRDVQVWGICCS